MKHVIQLRTGNMFDGPSDLVILPCSTGGRVSSFVAETLQHFHIPDPPGGMSLGDVEFAPFTGAEHVAQFVAFAATVGEEPTDLHVMRTIGAQLGQFTSDQEACRAVASPLLGTGAGGLDPELALRALAEGFVAEAASQATLIVSVLDESIAEKIRGEFGDEVTIRDRHIRVFVSYTGCAPGQREWVISLATFLRQNGINCRLDLWHLRRGMDLTQWMCNEVKLADRVVIVSDEHYSERADGRHGGVGWETMLIQGDLMSLPPETTKYVLIVRSDRFEDGVPMYLKTKFAFHWPTKKREDRSQLLAELLDERSAPSIKDPPLLLRFD